MYMMDAPMHAHTNRDFFSLPFELFFFALPWLRTAAVGATMGSKHEIVGSGAEYNVFLVCVCGFSWRSDHQNASVHILDGCLCVCG
jgi:hypothetical protein